MVSRHLHDSQCSIHHPISLFLKEIPQAFSGKRLQPPICAHRGCRYAGQALLQNLKQYPELGYEVIGFLDDYQQWDEIEARRLKPILGSVSDLHKVLNEKLVDEVVLALPLDAHNKYPEIIAACEKPVFGR